MISITFRRAMMRPCTATTVVWSSSSPRMPPLVWRQRGFASAVADVVEDPAPPTSSEPKVVPEENKVLEMNLRPSDVVKELDKHIVGQEDAKKAVAIAMRNRWRRMQLPDDLKKEVTPRNVLLVGPTGCGKTEVARRMAMLNDAPFRTLLRNLNFSLVQSQ